MPAIAQLVRWVANDHVELHVLSKQLGHASCDVVGVDEGIGVAFQIRAPVERGLTCAAERAFAVVPAVLAALKPDMSRFGAKCLGNRMLPIGVFAAIHAAPCQQGGEARDANAKYLSGQDVVHPRLQIGHLRGQPFNQSAGDGAQEHATFGAGVEKAHIGVCPNDGATMVARPGLGQRVQHAVGKFGWGEDLVVAQVGDAGEHIRVAAMQGERSLWSLQWDAHAGLIRFHSGCCQSRGACLLAWPAFYLRTSPGVPAF